MTTEALRTQLDTVRLEKQQLEVENTRLRKEHSDTAAVINAEAEAAWWRAEAAQVRAEKERLASEAAQLKAVYDQLLRDTQEEQSKTEELEQALERATAEAEEARVQCERLEADVTRVRDGTELQVFRVVAAERQQWEYPHSVCEPRNGKPQPGQGGARDGTRGC